MSHVRRIRAIGPLAALAIGSLAVVPMAGAQDPAPPGTEMLFNLEHVYNFNPQQHDPQAHEPTEAEPEPAEPPAGSDLEFFTHTVPLREYSTGAFVDEAGNPLPETDENGNPGSPVMAERDFAVVGSFQRGGYVFDITDPEHPQFVTQVTCRQDRNDVGITKLTDPVTGKTRVVLALTQQSGNPCPDAGAIGLVVNEPTELQGFHEGAQWAATGDVNGQTGRLVYAGTGCTPASYAPVADQIQGNIALVDDSVSADGTEQCPTYTFFQKVRAAQEAGAIGFVQITEEGTEPTSNATAIAADIPAIEIHHTADTIAVRDAVIGGTAVNASIGHGPSASTLLGDGSGGIGVFDITDPWAWRPMYRLLTGYGGVHNFIFHPTKPYGYASNGALPGGINQLPIVDFTLPDQPKVLPGPQTEGGVHDTEFSIEGNRAYAASENNYRIYDTTKPWDPQLISRIPNVGTYAHGVFPSPDLSLMVTNNESLTHGGFLVEGTAVCPGEGLASYDITDEANPVGPLGYYVPEVVGPVPDDRFCTSHFGRFAAGTKVMSIAWYIAGSRVVDWSDPSNPVELAGAVLEGSNTWATKFWKGPYVYAGDIGRGFDVFRWSGDGPAPWAPDAPPPDPAPSASPTSEPTPSPGPSPTESPSPGAPGTEPPPDENAAPPVEPGCTESWCRIQPGALLGDAEAGICTMGFVFRDNRTGRLLVSTAGHCTAKIGERLHAEESSDSFQMQSQPFGTVVFRNDSLDFALIEVEEGRESDVSASVRQWTGPLGAALAGETTRGDELLQYGYGFPFDSSDDTRARRGLLADQNEREFAANSAPGFGDSGAPVLHISGNALGLVSRISVTEAVSAYLGPTLQGMLAVLAKEGWQVALVPAEFTDPGAPIPLGTSATLDGALSLLR